MIENITTLGQAISDREAAEICLQANTEPQEKCPVCGENLGLKGKSSLISYWECKECGHFSGPLSDPTGEKVDAMIRDMQQRATEELREEINRLHDALTAKISVVDNLRAELDAAKDKLQAQYDWMQRFGYTPNEKRVESKRAHYICGNGINEEFELP